MQGLVDDDGIVVDSARVPLFTTTYYNTFHSHEALNFALYFPEPYDFKCSPEIIEVKDIDHPPDRCIRRIQLTSWYDRKTDMFDCYAVCPDKATDRQLQTHQNVTEFAENQ